MDMELYKKYIMCVYESDSLTQAAKKLGISQPALSSGLNSVEKKLGFKIFDRKITPPRPTKEGEIYLEYLQKEQKIVEDYQRKIADIHQMEGSKLVIGGPVVYVESLIAKAVAEFYKKYPKCEITIKNELVPDLIRQMKKGEIDCFISTSDELPESFQKIALKKEKIYLCIPRKWEINDKLAEYRVSVGETGKEFDYKVLDGLDFVFLEESQPLQKEVRRFFEENQIVPQSHLKVNQVSAALRLTALGVGASFISEEALSGKGQAEEFFTYSLPDIIFNRKIYAVCNGERYIPYACQELIKKMQELCEY